MIPTQHVKEVIMGGDVCEMGGTARCCGCSRRVLWKVLGSMKEWYIENCSTSVSSFASLAPGLSGGCLSTCSLCDVMLHRTKVMEIPQLRWQPTEA